MKKIFLFLLSFQLLYSAVNLEKCLGCHGEKFERKVFRSSKVVRDMKKEDITKALIGYKNRNYGGPMKPLMYSYVDNYTDEELSNTGLGK